MTLQELIAPQHVLAGLDVPDKPALLGELARRIAPAVGREAAEVARALAAREALGSTGVGGGIALPHALLAGLAQPVGLLARLAAPVAFEAVDGRPVDLVALLLSPGPNGGGEAHLHALAALSRRLRTAPVAAALRAATDAPGMYAALIAGGA